MKKSLFILSLLLIAALPTFGQLSFLLVDDSDDGFGHVSDFRAVVDSLGYSYGIFDAEGTKNIPLATTMGNFDLVIWFAGADLDSLAFWNFQDTTNSEIESYLNAGGMMWIIGTDLLFDRYGGAPRTFSSGSLEFDQMGLLSYDVQTYVDDSAQGLPLAVPSASSPIANLPSLDWIFSTLWYVDGVTGIPAGTQSVYEMGDSSYTFAGKTCGLYYDNGTSKVLSFFFNISQISTFEKQKDMTEAVLNFFSSQLVGVEESAAASQSLLLYPNPASDDFMIRFPDQFQASQVRIMDASGRLLESHTFSPNLRLGADLKPCYYFVLAEDAAGKLLRAPLVKL